MFFQIARHPSVIQQYSANRASILGISAFWVIHTWCNAITTNFILSIVVGAVNGCNFHCAALIKVNLIQFLNLKSMKMAKYHDYCLLYGFFCCLTGFHLRVAVTTQYALPPRGLY